MTCSPLLEGLLGLGSTTGPAVPDGEFGEEESRVTFVVVPCLLSAFFSLRISFCGPFGFGYRFAGHCFSNHMVRTEATRKPKEDLMSR